MANDNKNGSSAAKFIFWVIAVAAAFLLGFVFLGNHSTEQNTKTSAKEKIDYANQPYIGKASAPISIIEFGDYKCPNCKNFNEKVIPIVKQELIDNGQAKLYFMNDSFINTDSIRAAKFAESVYAVLGSQTFWKFHDLLYQKQPVGSQYEKQDVYTEKFLTDTLKEIAAGPSDVNKVVNYFQAKKSDAAWKKDMDLADQLNVSGTPTIFVNGKLFNGTTMNDLVKMADNALKGKKNE